jgi:2-polyprenyl-6-methoxyphenol hydroxylase-like FAD-dependent oxidoreductase
MASVAPSPRFDVVIGGAGPAGLAAAIEMRHEGLSVLVLEQRPELVPGAAGHPPEGGRRPHGSRERVVITSRPTVDTFSRWGIDVPRLAGGPVDVGQPLQLENGEIERAMLQPARAAGADVRLHTAVVDVQRGTDELTHVRTATGEMFSAPLYVEARGLEGSRPLLDELGIRRSRAPLGRHLAVGDLEALTPGAAPAGRERPVAGGRARAFDWLSDANSTSATLAVPRGTTKAQAAAWLQEAAIASGLEGTPAAVNVVDATATRAGRVALPGIVIVGDAAGTADPGLARGLNQGIRDGQRAAVLARRLARGVPPGLARTAYAVPVQLSHAWQGARSVLVAMPLAGRLAVLGSGVLGSAALARAVAPTAP